MIHLQRMFKGAAAVTGLFTSVLLPSLILALLFDVPPVLGVLYWAGFVLFCGATYAMGMLITDARV